MELLANIDVDDIGRAVAFYRDGLGLVPGRRIGRGAVEMLGAGSPIWLLEKPPGSRAAATTTQPRDYLRHWTPVHLDFVVDDVRAAARRAAEAGAAQEGDLESHSWGDIVRFADPFGHGFCLIQFRGRGYDEIAEPVRSASETPRSGSGRR